jgi:carboxyl-terminal processing protease
MSTLEIVLLLATAMALFTPLLRRLFPGLPRWLDFVPAGVVALMLIQIVVGGFQAYMTVAYAIIVLLFLLTFRRMIRPSLPVTPSRMRTVLALLGAVLAVVGLIIGVGSGPVAAVLAGDDLTGESWTAAFDRTSSILTKRYGFTEWKQIDWDALHAEYAPRIAAAEKANDWDAYHLALREYLFSIPDGHIILHGDDGDLWQEWIGGGYGLAVIELDDSSVIAHVLEGGGPAERAGMSWGAEILEWGGVPARQAIGAVSPIWMEFPPATQEGLRFAQQNLLTRAPLGTEVTVTFQNAGENAPQTATLTAVHDGQTSLYESLGWPASVGTRKALGDEVDESLVVRPPEYQILPEGYGYIKLYHVRPGDDDPDFAAIVEQAMAEFVEAGVPGVIVDVRGNPGGVDQLVPQMMGHFFSKPDFYQYQYFDNWLTGLSILDIAIPLRVEPKEPYYGGPVAVLVDQSTRSAGEGFPLLAQKLPQGHVVGVYGTHGSFGMCCGEISLPGDCELIFPPGRSHDANNHVQLEGDHNLQGGVVPDIRVPLTRDTVHAMFVRKQDIVLQHAIAALQE